MSPSELMSGFGNEFATEAEKGALPEGQNNPQKAPLGLYAEQLSGTAFTAPLRENFRSWLYKIHPSVLQSGFEKRDNKNLNTLTQETAPTPNQLRWDPLPLPKEKTDFVEGLVTFATNGNTHSQTGCAVHEYAINASMEDKYFYNADGELLIVPQEGELIFHTEMGKLNVAPKEIATIPRGVKFRVELKDAGARGYICENFGVSFRPPDKGPIGANGLANARDFLYPCAAYEEKQGSCEIWAKFQNNLWSCEADHSPLDVVAWHGNLAPYKYNLELFNTMGSISFDHPDPSIFTVLTSPTQQVGTANVDFVIFPRRWMVAEHTFRPPYYHRNVMSEFMGLIHGVYDAKEKGFSPGGSSVHNCMSPHGPEANVFEKASNADLKPQLYDHTLAFMFESRYTFCPTAWALNSELLQKDYLSCWDGLTAQFERP